MIGLFSNVFSSINRSGFEIQLLNYSAMASSPTFEIDVSKFVFENQITYYGGEEFLQPITGKTKRVWEVCKDLLEKEQKEGVLDIDTKTISTITSHKPGYIKKEDEVIVGLQTDSPLKRQIKPLGGLNIVKNACKSYGRDLDPRVEEIFSKYRKTHNECVFSIYTPEMKSARTNHIVTGLPDGYGRGRIIGDYRRVALYGIDFLIQSKMRDKELIWRDGTLNEEKMRDLVELSDQINALKQMKEMATSYGFDIGRPATSAKEAIQWTYFAYLAAIKEQDGAAMSLGRLDSFFDIYLERDLKSGKITEAEAQELIDQFVIKLRLVRHLRTPEYNELFAGDPTWTTISIGGIGRLSVPLVTRTSYRFLHTLYNLDPSAEPNMTVLWDEKLPPKFKSYCAKVSIDTSAIQYESDALMRPMLGSDYAIACCVSSMRVGKDMQFFGARVNLAKLLLYTLNNGADEITGKKVPSNASAEALPKIKCDENKPLDFDTVFKNYSAYMDWLAKLYVNTMNAIHYSHDRFCYEASQMSLHDSHIHRFMAFGVAGLSVVADSLSAIKHAKVYPIKDPKSGLVVDFKIEGDFPKYGNDDPRVDGIASEVVKDFTVKLKKNPTYRDAEHTLSLLTITSNVVYGKNTGNTPDGRKKGQPFSPGANPGHGRDVSGALASLNSVASMSFADCRDGISNTFSIIPRSLGKSEKEKAKNLVGLLDAYFEKRGFHLNVNVLDRDMLEDAMKHPEKYPNLTIRVSGYAVNFVKLSREQQKEVILRTFHDKF